ncbi:MAG TPA: hypothetical protein V6D33_01205, partial [Cyanophyceae cyanobacterium]
MTGIKISTSKTLTVIIAIAIASIGITSCVKSENSGSKQAQSNPVEQVKSNDLGNSQANPVAKVEKTEQTKTKQTSREQPSIGTVKNMVNGDLMCYVTLVDENEVQHEVGADFEICANQNTFLNQKVRVSYELVSINDCQSAEPCGKTRKESIITKMEIIGQGSANSSGNSQTISNGEWTITVGNTDSWSGVNGTGNLTYRGCDSKGKCINLTGGQVTCRNGVCVTGWRNGDYS